ncbi:cuticle protein 16.8 [Galendromus occidentalis]|uniref:Cuticle protein 16.8 n=1 Tax=Galendromus occidentalis TaxID=34638 RepID=A0AAJ6VX41_9ACAR|nr:cuticle protein 16.8 [Galendromus occidentalis]
MRAFSVVLAALCAVGASAQYAQYAQEPQYAPIPYQFAYKAESAEGSHSQEETSDGNNRRQGSYTIALADGRQRTVTYVADESGFRAEVTTNEIGTESKDAADAKYTSSAITGEQAAIQYGAQAPRENVRVVQAPARVVQAPAPVVRVAPAPIVRVAPAPVTIVKSAPAPIIRVAAPAPTIIKTVQSAPVIRYTQAAPTVVRTIQSAPVSYSVAHHAPVTYTAAAPQVIQVHGHDDHDLHVVHHKA